jgi:hypothetical protein
MRVHVVVLLVPRRALRRHHMQEAEHLCGQRVPATQASG